MLKSKNPSEAFAKAILKLYSNEKDIIWMHEVNQTLFSLFENNKELNSIFRDLTYSIEKKENFIKNILGDHFPQMYFNCLMLFLDHKHGKYFLELLNQINKKCLNYLSNIVAKIISALELTSEQKANLEKKLQSKYTNKLIFKYYVDSSLIMGLKIIIGDNVEAYNLKDQIEYLKKEFGKKLTNN